MIYDAWSGWHQTTKTFIKNTIFAVLIATLSLASTLSIVAPRFVGAVTEDPAPVSPAILNLDPVSDSELEFNAANQTSFSAEIIGFDEDNHNVRIYVGEDVDGGNGASWTYGAENLDKDGSWFSRILNKTAIENFQTDDFEGAYKFRAEVFDVATGSIIDSKTSNGLTLSAAEEADGPVYNKTRESSHDTIQEAIDEADEGDLLYVSAGTHTENGSINVNKSLTIRGDGKESTTVVIDGSGYGVRTSNNSDLDLTIEDLSLEASGNIFNFFMHITFNNSLTMNNVAVTGMGQDYYHSGGDAWGATVGGIDTNTVDHVTLSNVSVTETSRNALSFSNTSNITVSDINVYNNGARDGSAGVAIYGATTDSIDISGGMITGSPIGLNIGDSLLDLANNDDIRNVSFEDNKVQAVVSTGYIEDLIEYNHLDRAVVVRENPIVVPAIFSSIQDAIDAATDGNTVEVGPGTYDESLELNVENLTVVSTAGADDTIVNPGGANNGVRVLANMGNVIFDGFTITENWVRSGIGQGLSARDGTSFQVLNNVVKAPTTTTQHGNGIQVTGNDSSVVNNVVSVPNQVSEDWSGTGILIYGADTVAVYDNEVTSSPDDFCIAVAGGMFDQPISTNISVYENTVYGCWAGIIAQAGVDGMSVTDNIIYNNIVGVGVSGNDGFVPNAVVVEDNTFTENDPVQVADWDGVLDLPAVLSSNTYDKATIKGNFIVWERTPDANNSSVVYNDNFNGTGTLRFELADMNENPVEGLEPADFSVVSTSGNSFDFTHERFDVSDEGDGIYTVLYSPNTEVGPVFWDVSVKDVTINPELEVVVTIDEAPPTAPTITSPNARSWHRTTPILNEWTESIDEESGVAGYQVAYQYDEGYVFSGSTCSDEDLGIGDPDLFIGCRDVINGTSRNHVPTKAEQGGVTIWVRAFDNAGNFSEWSSPVHYYYDHESPMTTIEAPTGIVGNVFTVSGVAEDNLALNRVYVQLVNRDDGARYGGTTISLIGEGTSAEWAREYVADEAGLPDGTYAAHVSVVDMAGNTGSAGWTEDFIVDSTSPRFRNIDISPVNNNFTSGGLTVSFEIHEANGVDWDYNRTRVVLRDASGDQRVDVSLDDEVLCPEASDGVYACSVVIDTNDVEDGNYRVTIQARDLAGNFRSTVQFSGNTLVVDNTAPVAEIVNPADGDVVSGVVNLEGEVTDDNPMNSFFRIEGPDGYVETSLFTDGRSTHEFEWYTNSLADGVYTIFFEARDKADNKDGTRSNPGDSVDVIEVIVDNTIFTLLQKTENLSTLLAAVEVAELDGVLGDSEAEFTVFAPVDSAFAELLGELGIDADDLLASPDLAGILTYHVVAGVFESGDLTDGQVIETLEGTEITISIDNGDVFIIDEEGNQAQVKTPDVQASNGVVHIIDAVLLRTPTTTPDDAPPAEETTNETNPEVTTTDDVGTGGGAPAAFTVLGGLPVGGAPAVALGTADTGLAAVAVEEAADDETDDGETLGDATTVGDDEDGNGEVAGAADEADEAGWFNWAWALLAAAGLATLWLLAAARRRREEE